MAAPSGQLVEREIKLEAPEGFELPPLEGRRLRSKKLIAAYYDSEDLRLARTGVTLRHRVEGRARGRWQLKLPHADGRLELAFAGEPDTVPDEVKALLVALLRDAPLVRVCAMETRRSGVRVARDGEPLADVLIDEVTADVDGAERLHFRELEVEAIDGASSADLKRIAKALRRAGAVESDERPKLFRALRFEPARQAPVRADDGPREHVRRRIAGQREAMLAADPGTRLGSDPEALHDFRVAVRRLRSLLRAAAPLLEVVWTESLRDELKWVADALGDVRDLDVLLERLETEAAALDDGDDAAMALVLEALRAERETARARMLDVLGSERYLALLDGLEAAGAQTPPPGAEQVAVSAIAARQHHKLVKAVRKAGDHPDDATLHRLRIKGKRARYAAELAEDAVGRRARAYVACAKAFQDVLGAHQDAVVAQERLREQGLAADARAALAAGRLIERERDRARSAREAYPAAWKDLRRAGDKAWG